MTDLTPAQVADQTIDMFISELDHRSLRILEAGQIFAAPASAEQVQAIREIVVEEVRKATS